MLRHVAHAMRYAVREEDFVTVFGAGVTLVMIGTVSYALGERWNVVDAFYFAVATLTTTSVSDPDLVLDRPWMKVFTVFYLLISIGILVEILRRLGIAFVASELRSEPQAVNLSGRQRDGHLSIGRLAIASREIQRRWPQPTPGAASARRGPLWSSIQERMSREWVMTLPSGSFSAGSFVPPVAARSSSREPLRRKGIGLPWAATTLSYSMPAARSASWTRRHGCTLGPPSSPWQTYRAGVSAIPLLGFWARREPSGARLSGVAAASG
jgi:hypothetical protein